MYEDWQAIAQAEREDELLGDYYDIPEGWGWSSETDDEPWDSDDWDSDALRSIGWGTDEDYTRAEPDYWD